MQTYEHERKITRYKDSNKGCINVVQIDSSVKQVKLLKTGSTEPPKVFSFDSVFGV